MSEETSNTPANSPDSSRLRRTRVQTVSKNITGYGVLINENIMADTKIIPTIKHKSSYSSDEVKTNSFLLDFEDEEQLSNFFKEVGHSSFVFMHNVNKLNEQVFVDCRNANKDMFLKYIRRSCRPNCYFKEDKLGRTIDLCTYIDLAKNSELFIPVDRSIDFLNTYLKNLHQKIEKGQLLDTYPKNPFTNASINCASDNENLTPYIKTLKCICQEEECILFQIQTALNSLFDKSKKTTNKIAAFDGEKKSKKRSSESLTDTSVGLSREDRKLQYLIKMIDKMEKSTNDEGIDEDKQKKIRRKRSSPEFVRDKNDKNDKSEKSVKKAKKTDGSSQKANVTLFERDPKGNDVLRTVLMHNKFDSIALLYSSPRLRRFQRIKDLMAKKNSVK